MTCTETCNKPRPGARMEHCKANGCHQSFSGTESGDSHRIGEYGVKEGPDRRRCRSPEEMRAGGMWTTVDVTGREVWHGRYSTTGVQRRWRGAELEGRTDLTHEQGGSGTGY